MSTQKLSPIGNKLVIKLVEKKVVSVGGIYLVSADPSEANKGIVLSVGDKVFDVVVGDIVLPNWNNAQKTKVDGEDFYIITEDDIVLIFEE